MATKQTRLSDNTAEKVTACISLCSIPVRKGTLDRGTDERRKLQEAQLGCSRSVYPRHPADADLQRGIKQPEDVTNSDGSRYGHGSRTRPRSDR